MDLIKVKGLVIQKRTDSAIIRLVDGRLVSCKAPVFFRPAFEEVRVGSFVDALVTTKPNPVATQEEVTAFRKEYEAPKIITEEPIVADKVLPIDPPVIVRGKPLSVYELEEIAKAAPGPEFVAFWLIVVGGYSIRQATSLPAFRTSHVKWDGTVGRGNLNVWLKPRGRWVSVFGTARKHIETLWWLYGGYSDDVLISPTPMDRFRDIMFSISGPLARCGVNPMRMEEWSVYIGNELGSVPEGPEPSSLFIRKRSALMRKSGVEVFGRVFMYPFGDSLEPLYLVDKSVEPTQSGKTLWPLSKRFEFCAENPSFRHLVEHLT